MYANFSITIIDIDFVNKQVIINANYDIDPESVNESTIYITDKNTKNYENIKYKVENKKIYLIFKEWPIPNNDYILTIQSIKNILDEKLLSPIHRKIVFNSDITSKITIISPSNNSEIKKCSISWEEEAKDNIFIDSYYLELSTDPAFYNVIKKSNIIKSKTIDFDLPEDQYYIRIRAQKTSNNTIEYGKWSDIITFVIAKEENINQILLPEIDDTLNLISKPINGEIQQSFIFEFDEDIDYKSIQDIFVFRRDV